MATPRLGLRRNADLANPGTGNVNLVYNSCMAKAEDAGKVPLRGCGALSPLYDEALTWASGLHRHHVRKNTRVAYVAHLIAVSGLVLEDGGTETEAIAGLLHDAVEDCGGHLEPILRQRFEDAVVDIVMECSDAAPMHGEDKAPWAIRKQEYVDHFRTTASDSALRVSAADKLHNARATLSDLRESVPPGTWTPHNACHHQSLWYYQAISEAVTRWLPKSRTGVELAQVVTQLYAQTGPDGVEQPASAQRLVPSCADPTCTPARTP